MEFHLELEPRPLPSRIAHDHRIFLAGSCFTEHISAGLASYKFEILENPNGILFNPFSIARSLISYIENRRYTPGDLFYHNELWSSWDHHSRFSGIEPESVLHQINASQDRAHTFLKEADWVMLTFGSAFVYQIGAGQVVANCHKMPPQTFSRRLAGVEEIVSALDNLIHRLFLFNPKIRIIFTISPVRHLRDGFIENNRSKAVLITAVHQLIDKFEKLFYFPAYELLIDDLRDYRFYAEDMVHPNYLATDYVWKKFAAACLEPSLIPFMKEMDIINRAMNHRAFNPDSNAHQKFLLQQIEKLNVLQSQYPWLDFANELKFFKQSLDS
mgnify:FL=1